MLIGYMRVSQSDGTQTFDLQRNALLAAGVAKVLAGAEVQIDTTTANGRLGFGIFAALAEFEAELIRERTRTVLPRLAPGDVAGPASVQGRTFISTKLTE